MLLGCIGDDFTGSSDLGNMLTKAGMYVVQY
ncbi:MAG: four-carbon acid sugar kinase family protein, partial [Candidatus Puniceispirillaceae bacterium]